MKRNQYIIFVLIALGVAVYSFAVLRTPSKTVELSVPSKEKQVVSTPPKTPVEVLPPSRRQPTPAPTSSALAPLVQLAPRKKLVLDLDDLGVIKDLKQNRQKYKAADTPKAFLLNDNHGKSDPKTGVPTTIYKNGRMRIEGDAGLTDFPQKVDSVDEIKDNLEINSNLTVDF